MSRPHSDASLFGTDYHGVSACYSLLLLREAAQTAGGRRYVELLLVRRGFSSAIFPPLPPQDA